jgi:cytochrome c oxidase subunit 2
MRGHWIWALGLWLGLSASGTDQAEGTASDSSPLQIDVTGYRFRWHVRYPGADAQLGTKDDAWGERDVRVPTDQEVELILHSRDYLYSLALPHLALKEIAVPDLSFLIKLAPQPVGSFELRGDQFCGYSHAELIGELLVMPRAEFESWTAERSGNKGGLPD